MAVQTSFCAHLEMDTHRFPEVFFYSERQQERFKGFPKHFFLIKVRKRKTLTSKVNHEKKSCEVKENQNLQRISLQGYRRTTEVVMTTETACLPHSTSSDELQPKGGTQVCHRQYHLFGVALGTHCARFCPWTCPGL